MAYLAAGLVCLIGLVALVWHEVLPTSPESRQAHLPIPYSDGLDSDRYRAIAEGRLAEVESPFSKRVLYPYLAGTVSRGAHLPLPTAFLAVNMGCYVLLAFSLAAAAHKMGANPWYLVLCFLTPLPLEGLQSAYFPDLCHMSLLALFFLLWFTSMNMVLWPYCWPPFWLVKTLCSFVWPQGF